MRLATNARILALAALTFAVGVGAGWARWKKPPTNHKGYRWTVIHEHASQIRPGGTMILGDSIVERQRLTNLCGPVLNAGVGSATTDDLAPHIATLVKSSKPARIVINIGANDVELGLAPKTFKANLEQILAAARAQDVLVLGVPQGGEADQTLATAAQAHGARFLPYPVTSRDTLDGIHLNARGAGIWQRTVSLALCGAAEYAADQSAGR